MLTLQQIDAALRNSEHALHAAQNSAQLNLIGVGLVAIAQALRTSAEVQREALELARVQFEALKSNQ